MQEIILHHYDMSPFSEKIRLALGIKNLAWRSLEVSWILPRPHTMPMTGGYRRIPVLQMGADIYCDSQIIARALERRRPEPSLFGGHSLGLASMLGGWSDARFFTSAFPLVGGGLGERLPEAFIEDRKQMSGSAFDMKRIKAVLPAMREQYRAQADWVNEALADGRAFLLGDTPGWADINAYFNLWFVQKNCPWEADLLDRFEYLPVWMERVAAIGHGQPEEISGEQALSIARDSEPQTPEQSDPGEPNGLKPGQNLRIAADDYAKNPIEGVLVSSSAQHIAIRHENDQVGKVVIHFPRSGYYITPA